jgi:hypothetical protein
MRSGKCDAYELYTKRSTTNLRTLRFGVAKIISLVRVRCVQMQYLIVNCAFPSESVTLCGQRVSEGGHMWHLGM